MLRFAVFVPLLLTLLSAICDAVLVGGRGPNEESESNVIPASRFLYPRAVDEESPCKTDLGILGFCVDIRLCYAARRAVITGNHPTRCGWIDGYVPKVCCHPDQLQQPKVFRPYRFRYQRDYA